MHYSVLVIGENVEEQLAPFHEFECTGVDDDFVQDIERDIDCLRAKYMSDTADMLRGTDGSIHYPYKEIFYVNGEYVVPDGFTKIEIPVSQFMTFKEFIEYEHGHKQVPLGCDPDKQGEHKYGYILIDEHGNVTKAVNRTNPNKMWDWYQIGGRWPQMLKLKPGAKTDSLSYGKRSSLLRNDPIKIEYVDSARICDIDFDGMRYDREKSCSDNWDKYQSLRGDDKQNFMWECSIRVDDTKESYTKRLSTFSTYYVLHNGEWLEFEDEEAKYKIMELIKTLDPETRITVVDIHI